MTRMPMESLQLQSCAKAKDEFQDGLKNVYTYEVHGGLYGTTAKQELANKYCNSQEYKSVLAHVYVGLSDEEALRLATRHNI